MEKCVALAGQPLAVPERADDLERLRHPLDLLADRRPALAERRLVQRLAGAEAEVGAAGEHRLQRRPGLGDQHRVVARTGRRHRRCRGRRARSPARRRRARPRPGPTRPVPTRAAGDRCSRSPSKPAASAATAWRRQSVGRELLVGAEMEVAHGAPGTRGGGRRTGQRPDTHPAEIHGLIQTPPPRRYSAPMSDPALARRRLQLRRRPLRGHRAAASARSPAGASAASAAPAAAAGPTPAPPAAPSASSPARRRGRRLGPRRRRLGEGLLRPAAAARSAPATRPTTSRSASASAPSTRTPGSAPSAHQFTAYAAPWAPVSRRRPAALSRARPRRRRRLARRRPLRHPTK